MTQITETRSPSRVSGISTAIRDLLERRNLTQDDLATKAGLSRVQVNRILNGGWARTRPETRVQILSALAVSEEDLLGIDSLQQYRAFVLEKFRLQSFAGLGFAEHHRRPLDSFYVAPNAVPVASKKPESGRFDEDTCDTELKQAEPKSAVEWISKSSRAVVLGVPGAGKTTLLNYMASKVASEGLGGADTPIVVRLPEFALAIEKQPDLNFIDWAVSRADESRCTNIGPTLQGKLLSDPSSMLFLLDGLDEVPLGRQGEAVGDISLRTRVIRAIERVVKNAPDAKYVLTSRVNGFDPSPWNNLRFEQFRLLEYGEDQIRDAVKKWSLILATTKAETPEKISKDLADAIFGNTRVNQLARNPLTLTVLILMCKSRGYALPRRRVDLYAKITEVFLDTWDASKQKEFGFREIGFVDLDPRELSWLIGELALAMQRAGLVTAHRWWIVDSLHNTLCNRIGFDAKIAKEQTDPILTFLSEHAGLLEQRMPSVYAFTHRTMQEYFAAIGLELEAEGNSNTTGSLPDLMRSYLFHPEWSEVVRLVAAHVSPARAEELLRVIADDADPTGRFLKRGPLLALRCLSDGATVPSRQFTQSVFDSLDTQGESPWYWLTLELFSILPAFDGTRHEQSAAALRSAILGRSEKCQPTYVYHKLKLANVTPNFDSWQPTDEVPKSTPAIVKALKKAIASDAEVSVREEAVSALASLTQPSEETQALLLGIARNENENGDVRAASIRGLHVLEFQDECEEMLLAFLANKNEQEEVRVVSAFKLESLVSRSQTVRDAILQIANAESNSRVGMASVSALQSLCSEYIEQFRSWSRDDTRHAIEASLVLSDELLSGKLAWNEDTVLELEGQLIAVGKGHAGDGKPCRHMLDAISNLCNARERLSGLCVESVLRDTLRPLGERLAYGFVYGSTARNAQSAESDIDLMLLGDVSQREIGSLIKKAESILGREIRPTIYSLDDFAAKFQQGNRFACDVMDKPKKFIELGGIKRTEEGLKDDLRAMAKKQLAS